MFHWFRQNGPRAQLPAGERVYAIGDVHGEGLLLELLLRQVDADDRDRDPAKVTLVLLGDIIDRGQDSADLLRTLHNLSHPSFVLLKGNHEDLLVQSWHGNDDALDLWLRVGGRATLAGFGVDPAVIDRGLIDRTGTATLVEAIRAAIDPRLIDWVDRLPTAWSIGDYFFAHAGVRPGTSLDRQSDVDLMWVRDAFLSSRSNHGKVVVHGHSIKPGVPQLGGNRIGLDTGAHEHRRLTALGLEGDRQWLLQAGDPGIAPVAELAPVRDAPVRSARSPTFA